MMGIQAITPRCREGRWGGAWPQEGHLCAAAGVALQADVLVARTAALGGLGEKEAGGSAGEAASPRLRAPALGSGGCWAGSREV